MMPGAQVPLAHAAPCTDAEVIFARGTEELPGVGPVGQAFVDSLRSQVGEKSLGVYAVDYPATTAFSTAVEGINDARTHILTTAANCPLTKIVLGGFSQGAAVIGFVTADAVPDGVTLPNVPEPMPPEIADHVAAVALFGKPSPRFMRAIRDPQITIGEQYQPKTIDLCIDNDLVCDPHGSSFSVHTKYEDSDLLAQGVEFVASHLRESWAADVPTPIPGSAPTPGPLPGPAPAASAPAPADPALSELWAISSGQR